MPFPFDPSPSTLWTLQRDGAVASCEVRFVPLGSEVRMLRNGSLLVSQVFSDGDEALAWAEEERQRMLGNGSRRCISKRFLTWTSGLLGDKTHRGVRRPYRPRFVDREFPDRSY